MSTAPKLELLATPAIHPIPEVESRVFDDVNAPFYIGILASKNVVNLPGEYLSALRLRANVYIDEFKFLPPEARQADGTERDSDDDRSHHYGVVENIGGTSRIVGTMRAIIKDDSVDILPAEKIFPELFESQPAPIGSLEASRFIARHPDKRVQSAISISLIRTIVAQSLEYDHKPVYAIVEEPFYKLLQKIKLPLEKLSNPKATPEYNNTENMLLRFMPEEIMEQVVKNPESRRLLSSYFKTVPINKGIGHYDSRLVVPQPLSD